MGSLAAQQSPDAPLRPSADVALDARDAGYPAWRDANAQRAMPPIHVSAARYEILIRSPGDAARNRHAGGLVEAAMACQSRFELNDEQVDALTYRDPWAEFEARADGPFVTIVVVPAAARPVACGQGTATRNALLNAALRFGEDTMAHPANDAARVEVYLDDAPIRLAQVGRTPVTKVAFGGVVQSDGTHALKVWISYDALALLSPKSRTLTLLISNNVLTEPQRVSIPAQQLRDLWREILPWRMARLAGAAPSTQPITLPEARSPELQTARLAFEQGRLADGGIAAIGAMQVGKLNAGDELLAGVLAGASFASLQDDAAARQMFVAVLAAEPCFSFPETVNTALRSLVESLRPAARCDVRPIGDVVRLAVVPGRAHQQFQPNTPGAGRGVRNVIYGLAAASVVTHLLAANSHRSYMVDFQNPDARYAAVRTFTTAGNVLGATTYAVWAGSILHAIRLERAHEQRLRRVEDYGSRDQRAIEIRPSSHGLGFAVVVF